MSEATELIDDVAEALNEVGVQLTFDDVTYVNDPYTSVGTPTPDPHTAYCSPPALEKVYRDGHLVPTGRTEVTLANKDLTFTPKLGIQLTISGKDYTVDEIRDERMGDGAGAEVIVAYTLWLKGP